MLPDRLAVYRPTSPYPVAAGGSPDLGTVGSGSLKRRVQTIPTTSTPKMSKRRGEQQSRQGGRLPPIAPAPRDTQPQPSLRAETASSSNATSARPPRTRLPPRSRSGCWTCRTRKVKCDEKRPQCNQCTRLGHVCDYNPRLAFKDETSKIVEKYLGGGGPARQWDTSQRLQLEPQSEREADTPVPFSALSTEPEWEKKAGHRAPGTFYVIANSSSFPPSGDSTPTSATPRSPSDAAPSRRHSKTFSVTTEVSDDSLRRDIANIALDEDTVILGSFDETSRQSQGGSAVSSMLMLEASRYSPGSPLPGSFFQTQANLPFPGPASLPYPVGRYTQEDLRRRHYRTVVRRHMFNVNGNEGTASPGVADIFEHEIQNFPLLGAAIDELAAWSLAVNGNLQNFDTQERYLEILASLRSHNTEEDLKQDGMFLTHVLLLVYEISASHRSWHLHLAALLHIFQIRGRDLVRRYPLIIWWIALQDINALLCGSGPGNFVDFIFENNLAPTVADIRNGQTPGGMQLPQTPSDGQQFMMMLNVLARLINHARELGRMSSFFRQSFTDWFSPGSQTARLSALASWQQQVDAARLSLEQTWTSNLPALVDIFGETESLPELTASVAETVWFLYHSLVIYSHTSMWPTQRLDEAFSHDAGIVAHCCNLILERVNNMLNRGEFARRLVVFPLFLAGFFSIIPLEKTRAHDLLHLMERGSIGNNTRATRRWLQRLFGDQAMAQEAEVPLSVDWIQKIQEQDFCIVHCGF